MTRLDAIQVLILQHYKAIRELEEERVELRQLKQAADLPFGDPVPAGVEITSETAPTDGSG